LQQRRANVMPTTNAPEVLAVADKPAVKYVETTGELLAPDEKGQNYRIKVVAGDAPMLYVYVLAFDDGRMKGDQFERFKAINKALPDLVGKQVTVTHREGFFGLGETKMLLCNDIKEVKK
jgi:hypothetical protein